MSFVSLNSGLFAYLSILCSLFPWRDTPSLHVHLYGSQGADLMKRKC